MKIHLMTLAALSLSLFSQIGMAARKAPLFSAVELERIMGVARRIHVINPFLDDTKYMEYATGIYKASRKYAIDENVLIAIAQRETGFREDLPEGAAGERGICQIRKNWLKNKYFVREFRKQTIADLEKPAKSFMFAAWILSDLKRNNSKGSLPYWSFYNAVRFEPRFRYYVAVNQNLSVLYKYVDTELDSVQLPRAITREPMAVKARPVVKEAKVNELPELMTSESQWIPDALRRIQEQKSQRKEGNLKNAFLSEDFKRQLASNE